VLSPEVLAVLRTIRMAEEMAGEDSQPNQANRFQTVADRDPLINSPLADSVADRDPPVNSSFADSFPNVAIRSPLVNSTLTQNSSSTTESALESLNISGGSRDMLESSSSSMQLDESSDTPKVNPAKTNFQIKCSSILRSQKIRRM
jgi:hypothetical protein